MSTKRCVLAIYFLCLLWEPLFSQNMQKEQKDQEEQMDVSQNIPAQAQYSNKFKIQEIYFNKIIDVAGRGEILEVEFRINNRIDDPLDLYIFVIATYEKDEKTKSSFEMPIQKKGKIRSFVPFPEDKQNFKYTNSEKEGKAELRKFPKDPKAGVDPSTGKPYHLKDSIFVRTYHLSKYRNNYFFFNEVTLLVFDKNGNILFRQLYNISGVRR